MQGTSKIRNWVDVKVAHDMRKRGVSAERAFGALTDLIRYTFQYPDNRYSDGVRADVERMRREGLELAGWRNMWSETDAQCGKGIVSLWRLPVEGQVFEMRFHTAASYAAMQETFMAYSRLRELPTDLSLVRELRAYQRFVTAQVPVPPGALELTTAEFMGREEA